MTTCLTFMTMHSISALCYSYIHPFTIILYFFLKHRTRNKTVPNNSRVCWIHHRSNIAKLAQSESQSTKLGHTTILWLWIRIRIYNETDNPIFHSYHFQPLLHTGGYLYFDTPIIKKGCAEIKLHFTKCDGKVIVVCQKAPLSWTALLARAVFIILLPLDKEKEEEMDDEGEEVSQ
eukprot:2932422-Ditylum_brightwellii.AAC.1